jgi:hypothetical protein
MSQWAKVADRGMGYVGLFLLGAIAWLADRGAVHAAAPRLAAGPKPGPTTRRAAA